MELPSRTFALAYKLYPAERSNRPTVHELTGCPRAVSSAASVRVDFDVHRNADIGSPRVSGSTMASKAASRPGSVAVNGLRPPPRLAGAPGPSEPPRTPNPAGPFRPSGDTPAARATSVTPPRPNSRAFAPSTSLPLIQMRPQRGRLTRHRLRAHRPHHERRSQIRVSTAKSYAICSRVLTTYRWRQPALSL